MAPALLVLALVIACWGVLGYARGRQSATRTPATIFIIDLQSDDTIARCGRNGGLAGWLQRIDEQGEYIDPPAELYCVIREKP